MKVITWNCNMAFRKKWKAIMAYQPDLLILQECEQASKYKPEQIIPNCNQFIWVGANPNKGVGILSFNNYHIELSENYNPAFKYIIPVKVTGERTFQLFAVWAMPDKENRANSYVVQIWNAMNYYEADLTKDTMIIGDWNSNKIFDKKRRIGNHSHLVDLLKKYGITSVYHELRQEEHGLELEPTFFLLKNKTKPFHFDFCAVSENLMTQKTNIQVGKFEDWIKLSDHTPIIIDELS